MGFFRYIFLIGIVTGSTSIGFLLSKSYSDRLTELKGLVKLINILQNKLKFTHKPLAEIFEEISLLNSNSKVGEIFLKASKKLKENNAETSWKEAIMEEAFFLNLKNEDIELIKSFGNMLGKTDIEGQISEINQFITLINGQIAVAEEEKNKNSKMYKSLGTIIGLVIVIILF